MHAKWLRAAFVSAAAVVIALAFAASTTSAGTSIASTPAVTPASSGLQQIGSVNVALKINKFVKRGKHLVALGTAVTSFQPTPENPAGLTPATTTQPFTAPVTTMKQIASAQRLCPVLSLTLGQLDLVLLGLHAHLDKVHLTITADSKGGPLGSLFCSLVHAKVSLSKRAQQYTRVARKSSLHTKGVSFGVPLYRPAPSSAPAGSGANPAAPQTICPILDLTLGPLDLDLLGLMVHLDVVHLVITADSTGGVLGSLLCGLAGGSPAAASSS